MSAAEQPINPQEAWALSRILQGLPADGVEIDAFDDRLRQLAKRVSGERNGTAAVAIFTRELAAWPDGGEIMRAVFSADPEEEHPPEPHRRFRVMSVADIIAIEAPSWRIDGLLQQGALSLLYSPAGGGKTFGALAMAFSIATGRDCFGFTAQPATVAYLVAEGLGGMGVRVRAYLEHHGVEQPTNLHFLAGVISLMDATQVLELIAELRRLKVEVLFVDTLARSMDGGDENSTRDMSLVIANVEMIRQQLGCEIVLVHHSGHNAERERGSSALRAAVDTKLALSGTADELVLTVEKHRDWETGLEVPLRLTVVDLGNGERSCVIERRSHSTSDLGQSELRALRSLYEAFGEIGATNSEWKETVEADHRIPHTTFYRVKRKLLKLGLVEGEDGKRGARFTVAPTGLQALSIERPFGAED
jgi:hypothetical protein